MFRPTAIPASFVQFLTLIILFLVTSFTYANNQQIRNHPSPYVAMHADDLVQWRTWSAQTREEAKRTNKPLFLSIGYFSCYWCHVMQRENFKNKNIATILNQNYIPVIVDRELNPALDAYLIRFVEKYAGRSGWPLQVILTPEALPAVGGLYMPPEQFNNWLTQTIDLWKKDPALVRQSARLAVHALGQQDIEQNPVNSQFIHRSQNNFIKSALQHADDMEGGFGDQSKFPLPATLMSLIMLHEKIPVAELETFLLLTLNTMATRGLRDHLAGGFFRYTVDPGWQEPHFEKMLYDNAQLALLYLHAGRIFQNDFFTYIATSTLDFMLRDMKGKQGFISSLSAIDEHGEEGGFYFWSEEDVHKQLSIQEAQIIKALWLMDQPSHFSQGYLPVFNPDLASIAKNLKMETNQARKLYHTAREKLLQIRETRNIPRDNKQLTAWNALALWAFADAAIETGNLVYKQTASDLKNFLTRDLWDGKNLKRARTDKVFIENAGLEDYVYTARALFTWLDIAEESKNADLSILQKITQQAWLRFYSEQGWMAAKDTGIPAMNAETIIPDGPMPSPSALLIQTTLMLKSTYGIHDMAAFAQQALKLGHNNIRKDIFWYGNQLIALEKSAKK